MFTQEIHPFYKLILENKYSIHTVQSDHAIWFEIKCCGKSLFMNEEFNVVRVKDIVGQESRSLIYVQCELFSKKERIEFFVKEYIHKIKASLDPQNISIMNMILLEIVKKYPDVSYVEFSRKETINKNHGFLDQNSTIYTLEDQDNNLYNIECENLSNFLSNFCFLDSLSLSLSTRIKKLSNHELLEYALKSELIHQKFGMNPKIEMMDM